MFGEGLFSPWHLLVLLFICVLFFGNRIPEIARALGKGVDEFKKGVRGLEDENTDWQEPKSLPRPAEKLQPPPRADLAQPKFEQGADPAAVRE
jgi:sec-independent protein translocase protein TatA